MTIRALSLSKWTMAIAAIAVTLFALKPSPLAAGEPHQVAFLGVHFQNDNEMYEPTSDAERARLANVAEIFKDQLAGSGHFRFSDVAPEMKERIAAGQAPGECGGCEITYGKEIGSEMVAWVNIQKVSNLIINMNVYIADVANNKMVFVRSVDVRGNTDESWARSINYLIKNYLLPGVS